VRAFPPEQKLKKNAPSNEAEYRNALQSVLDDVIAVLFTPEFPIAEQIALQFTYLMVQRVECY
jgi:hypothetical protein